MDAQGTELERSLRAAGFDGELKSNAPLAPLTTWRIGGPAQLLAAPRNRDDLAIALSWASARDLPWRILGNGSNLLVRDAGVPGLVLRMRGVLDEVEMRGTEMHAGAGASFPAVARLAAGAGLSGIEFGAGIPGTVGGAVAMNAGWHEFELGNVITCAEFLEPDGAVRRYDRSACEFRYRGSLFRRRRGVVLRASLQLVRAAPAEVRSRLASFAVSRKENQPTELPSCGSVFLKPPGDFAGRLIEQADLKGARVGDLQVSPKHANFIVNLGRGRAEDALALVERIECEVFDRFGVKLEREFEIW